MITKLNRLWKRLLDKKKIGSFEFRMKINAPERKWYAYILYNSAMLAKKLNFNRISAIEYGVDYLDTANIYGESEKKIGQLSDITKEFRLITKTVLLILL